MMWITNKDQSSTIDAHGKAIVNWIITMIIASVICFILLIVLIGAFGFFVLGIVNVVFIIIAAIKANNGELWSYPFSFKFIK